MCYDQAKIIIKVDSLRLIRPTVTNVWYDAGWIKAGGRIHIYTITHPDF
jgi:hypothetical protein